MDYLKMVEDRESELNPRFARMDADKDLYYLKSFTLKDLDGKEVPNVNNLTLNDPATFAKRAMAILIGANMQTVVEGKSMKDKETTFIEEFLDNLYQMVDTRLNKIRRWASMYGFECEQAAMRGGLVARCLLRMKGDQFIPDILPVDDRYVIPEMGMEDLKWIAYKSTRTKARIQAEYGIEIRNTSAIVTDLWDDEFNRVFIDRVQAIEQPNPYGYIPFVYVLVGGGSMLQDEDAIEHEGESIFMQNRDLYPELNRLATVLNTLNEMAFNGALQYESEAGSQAARPELPPFGKRVVIPVEKGGGYKPMPFNDIRAATQLLYSVLESRIQRGALPAVDYGNLNFPLSAVAISRLTEGKDQIFLPRIQALAMFYQQLSQMAIRQYKDFGMNVELGQEGYTQQYPYKDLDGRYSITYRFFTTSSEQRIADLSIAAGSRDFLSEDTIRRDVLKLQDPDGEYMKKRAEMAERVDPAIALYRYACSLIDQEEYIEARMIAQTAVAMIRQRQLGGQVEAAPQEQKSPQVGPKDLIPLLTAGGGGRQMPKGEPQPQVQEPAPTGG